MANRKRREEIFIERLESAYEADIDSVELEDKVLKADPPKVIEKKGTEKRSGFVVRLLGRTPHEDTIRFVADRFRNSLLETGRQPDQGFFINRIVFTSGRKFTEKESRKSSSTSPRGGWGRGGRSQNLTPTPSTRSSGEEIYDPVTDERMDGDWVFEMVMDVVLQNLPVEKDKKDATTDGP